MEKEITQIEEFVIKWLESQEEKKCFEPDKDGYIMFRRGGLSINLPVYLMMVLEDYLEEQALSKAEGKGEEFETSYGEVLSTIRTPIEEPTNSLDELESFISEYVELSGKPTIRVIDIKMLLSEIKSLKSKYEKYK